MSTIFISIIIILSAGSTFVIRTIGYNIFLSILIPLIVLNGIIFAHDYLVTGFISGWIFIGHTLLSLLILAGSCIANLVWFFGSLKFHK